MAHATVIVCDQTGCEQLATSTITFHVQGSTARRSKDLCAEHLNEIQRGARDASRGRPPTKTTGTKPRKPAARRKRTTTKGETA